MKITVFGATGGTGRQMVRQAQQAGHQVTAVVRRPSEFAGSNVTVVEADVLDPASIAEAVQGRDAVLSALGPRANRPSTVCTEGTASIIRAMNAQDVHRLVVVSAAGFHTEGDDLFTRVVLKPIVKRLLRHPFADSAGMEKVVRASDLDWTIMLPPRLLDKPGTGTYRTAKDRTVPRGFRVARADVADCALRCLTDPGSVRAAVALAD